MSQLISRLRVQSYNRPITEHEGNTMSNNSTHNITQSQMSNRESYLVHRWVNLLQECNIVLRDVIAKSAREVYRCCTGLADCSGLTTLDFLANIRIVGLRMNEQNVQYEINLTQSIKQRIRTIHKIRSKFHTFGKNSYHYSTHIRVASKASFSQDSLWNFLHQQLVTHMTRN